MFMLNMQPCRRWHDVEFFLHTSLHIESEKKQKTTFSLFADVADARWS